MELADILCSTHYRKYKKNNPLTCKDIEYFLETLPSIKGLDKTLVAIEKDKINWFNYFSELRCAHYFNEQGWEIIEYNAPSGDKDVDFLLKGNIKCDVLSFSPHFGSIKNAVVSTTDYDELEKYLDRVKKKIKSKRLDILIIDTIFSGYQNNKRFISYYFETSAHLNVIKEMLEARYLDKIIILTFASNIYRNPIINYVGKEVAPYIRDE